MDLDGDGDLDGVGASSSYGVVHFFENTGPATNPAFAERTGAANPFDRFILAAIGYPTFGDIDSDGDFDLFGGLAAIHYYNRRLYFLENLGTATQPDFRGGNPLTGIPVPGYFSRSALVDIDADGDFDVAACATGRGHQYYCSFLKNIGSVTDPVFDGTRLGGIDLGRSDEPSYSIAALAFADLDNDGDLDAYVGSDVSSFLENTGTASNPHLVPGTLALYGSPCSYAVAGAAFADLDADGDFDLVLTCEVYDEQQYTFNPRLEYFENAGSPEAPVLTARFGAENPFDGLPPLGGQALFDVEGDGDLDLIMGSYVFENVGSAAAPAFSRVPAAIEWVGRNPAQQPPLGHHPGFTDLDGDGDLDRLSTASTGGASDRFLFFRNVTPPQALPACEAPSPLRFSGFRVQPNHREFLELTHTGSHTVRLDGCTLVLFDGATGQSYHAFALTGPLAPGSAFRLGTSAVAGISMTFPDATLQNGPDAAALYRGAATDFPDGTPVQRADLVEALVYYSNTNFYTTLGPQAGEAAGKQHLDPSAWFGRFSGGAAQDATALLNERGALPQAVVLEGNRPNPFNPETVVRYGLPEAAPVRLVVYDVQGREVARLVDRVQEAGWHAVVFQGQALPSGLYLCRLQVGVVTRTIPMLLVK